MAPPARPPPPPWVGGAAAAFCAPGLPRPALYGSPPRRDVIGWVAGLVRKDLTPRWLALCAALRIRHPFGGDAEAADVDMVAVVGAIVEQMVMPLQEGETKRVLTTNVRRHVRRSAVAGLTFMHVFDFFLALFDLEEALHNSTVGAFCARGVGAVEAPRPDGASLSYTSSLTASPTASVHATPAGVRAKSAAVGDVGDAYADVDGDAVMGALDAVLSDGASDCSGDAAAAAFVAPRLPRGGLAQQNGNGAADCRARVAAQYGGGVNGGALEGAMEGEEEEGDEEMVVERDATGQDVGSEGKDDGGPGWTDVFALKFCFNIAVEKFRVVCDAVGTRHVRELIERATCDYEWARKHASVCGLDLGQARVIQLVTLKGSSREGESALMRSHFTVYQENDPLVFAAALSTLDPHRAILVADRYVGISVRPNAIVLSANGTKIGLGGARTANNIRKLMYADALCSRLETGVISQSSFMHLTHKLTMLNSGLGAGTPGSKWAELWPQWPALQASDKETLETRYRFGNIVAGALLAATVLANHIIGIGSITRSEYYESLATLKRISELGDAVAPSYLGLALSQPGNTQDMDGAKQYYRMAVERGNKNAPAALGTLLLQNGGDAVECVDLFKLTIARGGRYGHRYLADVVYHGATGVPQDREYAKQLYGEAARLGDPIAIEALAGIKKGLFNPPNPV